MAWRTIGSNRYYQETYRDHDGRVRSRYIGRGPAAEAVAWLDARARERLRETREATHEVAERSRRMGEAARGRLLSPAAIVGRVRSRAAAFGTAGPGDGGGKNPQP
jgi:hypothetical protein